MNGLQLTDRLIENINNSITIRGRVADPYAQIKGVSEGKVNLKDFWSSLNTWDFDAHLDIVSQFINLKDTYVDHTKGAKVDIKVFQRDVTANRVKIAKQFQELLDNKNLVDLVSKRPISEHLKQQLDWINSAAQ